MSNFVIFEDQENFQEKTAETFADARKNRVKLAPLAIKAINKENDIDIKVRKICLPLFSLLFILLPRGDFIVALLG